MSHCINQIFSSKEGAAIVKLKAIPRSDYENME